MDVQTTKTGENGQKLFSVQDVATALSISRAAIYIWLKKHYKFTDNNEYIVKEGNGQKPKLFFTENGLLVYLSLREGIKSNRYMPYKDSIHLQNTKELITNKVVESHNHVQPVSDDPIMAQLQNMMMIRQEQLKQQEELNKMRGDLGDLQEQMRVVILNKQEAQQELLSLPEPNVLAPVRTVRSLVVECVNTFVKKTNVPYQDVWNKLYKEYSIRLHENIRQRSGKLKLSQLEYIELHGDMEVLYAISKEILSS